MQIKIKALDTLFFRDGKPFSMGEESWADGIFPPPPSVFYGALRTLYFSQNSENIKALDEGLDNSISLRINNLMLSKQNNPFFICPNDYANIKGTKNHTLLSLKPNENTISSYFLDYILFSDQKLDAVEPNHFLGSSNFEDYLKGDCPDSPQKFNFYKEPKVGIGRDKQTNTTAESKLYRVGMQRLSDEYNNRFEFVLDIADLFDEKENKLTNGFVKIGGEGKTGELNIVEESNPIIIQTITSLNSEYFKIVLTNPAIFKHGWFPSFLDKDNSFQGLWNGVNVQLIAAALGKPLYLGGFDMKKKEPKPMFKAIPAGSVYFFKVLDTFDKDVFMDIPQPFKFTDERAEEGFGTAYLGNITNQLLK
jgi:CRISPR-associated protein Cmr3